MNAWAAALRIARREARRAKGRSVLVLVMIALPVAVISYLAASYDMFDLTVQEKLDRRLGTADALITWESAGPIEQSAEGFQTGGWGGGSPGRKTDADLLAKLPAGSRVVRIGDGVTRVRTPDGVTSMPSKFIADLTDPLLQGVVKVLRGKAPAHPGEIALNPAAAERLGVELGGTVRTLSPEASYTVTAIVEFPTSLAAHLVLSGGEDAQVVWLAKTPHPLDWAAVGELNRSGIAVASRPVMLDPPPGTGTPGGDDAARIGIGLIIIGLVIVEIVLLAGPAFAVGAKRRARQLALVAASGGEPRHLRRIVLADGVVLGAGGAVLGIALGVVAAFASLPLLEEYGGNSRAGGYRAFPLAQLGVAFLAVGTGLLAALAPAITAGRQDVVQILAGRRGTLRSRKRWAVLGIVVAAGGAGVAVLGGRAGAEELILGGIVLVELGLVIVTPGLIGLVARAGRWLSPAPRLALRHTARNRSAASPAISAIMAAVAGAVTIGVFSEGVAQQRIQDYQQMMPLGYVMVHAGKNLDFTRAAAAVGEILPDADVRVYKAIRCPQEGKACRFNLEPPPERRCPEGVRGQQAVEHERCVALFTSRVSSNFLVVDDGDAVAALTDADPVEVERARATLKSGGVVVTNPIYIKEGKVLLNDVPYDGYLMTAEHSGAMAIVPESAAARFGFGTVPIGIIAGTREMPTQAQEDRLGEALAQLDGDAMVSVARGTQPSKDPIALILALGAALVALAAAAIATGLAAADTRPDLVTLGAVGAAPRVRRLLSLSQAGVISGLGSVLGTATGLGAAAVLIYSLNRFYAADVLGPSQMPLRVPWEALAIIVAVPLIAMAGAGLFTKSRLPIEQRP